MATRTLSPMARNLQKVAFLGTYLPRRCGIATFTSDLCEAVAEEAPAVQCLAVALNDTAEGYDYPPRVRFEISHNVISEYRNAADFLNVSNTDVVCVQHEYGIFGGSSGSHVLAALRELRTPIVTTFHTILAEPSPEEKRILGEIAQLSDRLVVMAQKAVELLRDIYNVPEEKIAFIHHGIPDLPFVDPSYYKDTFGLEGRRVILTFGLLSPGKGIENAIAALPRVVEKHPDIVYVVLGATHPVVKRENGEEYRYSLQRQAKALGVEDNIVFHNRFVALDELCEFLGAADVYVTPYPHEAQICSGTLAYAAGAGKAVVSTPYWYARELLAEERGKLVPFGDAGALAEAVNHLFDNEVERHAMRKRAYLLGREMIWKEVARRYLETFAETREERSRAPKKLIHVVPGAHDLEEAPAVDLRHLQRLTDDTGTFHCAKFTVPDRHYGYTTDDNARALVVAVRAARLVGQREEEFADLAATCLSFLENAFVRKTGRFRNSMSYDRKWQEEEEFSEDTHGNALLALGSAAAFAEDKGLAALSTNLFHEALPAVTKLQYWRGLALSLVGIHQYLRRYGGDTEARRMRGLLAEKLYERFRRNAVDDWPWLEESLTYINGRLPQALLLSGQWMQRGEMIETGLRALEFLLRVQTSPEGHFAPVGSHGWFPRGGVKARFNQLPIETHSMVVGCVEAWFVTQEARWLDEAQRCFEWFLGRNDLGIPLYDYASGGCRDALYPDRANQNQGAESTIAWLLSAIAMEEVRTPEAVSTPEAISESEAVPPEGSREAPRANGTVT